MMIVTRGIFYVGMGEKKGNFVWRLSVSFLVRSLLVNLAYNTTNQAMFIAHKTTMTSITYIVTLD